MGIPPPTLKWPSSIEILIPDGLEIKPLSEEFLELSKGRVPSLSSSGSTETVRRRSALEGQRSIKHKVVATKSSRFFVNQEEEDDSRPVTHTSEFFEHKEESYEDEKEGEE